MAIDSKQHVNNLTKMYKIYYPCEKNQSGIKVLQMVEKYYIPKPFYIIITNDDDIKVDKSDRSYKSSEYLETNKEIVDLFKKYLKLSEKSDKENKLFLEKTKYKKTCKKTLKKLLNQF